MTPQSSSTSGPSAPKPKSESSPPQVFGKGRCLSCGELTTLLQSPLGPCCPSCHPEGIP